MRIEKKYSYSTLPSFTAKSRGMTVAQEHLSSLPTRLALARWTRGGDIPHVHASERNLPMRAGWYTKAQEHFMAWLEAGGFHQTGHVCSNCARREADRGRTAMVGMGGHANEHATSPVPSIGSWPGPEKQR